jgi:hypothetical protein
MRPLLLAFLVALPCFASAQSIYKVQTPDGSILFTDTPPPGSKILEERSAKPAPRAPGNAAGSAPAPKGASPGSAAPGAASAPSAHSIEAAMQEVKSAEAAVQVAKRRLELGREPLPGERRGLAGGGSRLTEEYQSRVAGLEREVADAQERLKRAYDARNDAR